jgi:nitric oxide reductase NorE protein
LNKQSIDYQNIYYPPGGILLWIIIFLELFTFGAAIIAMVVQGQAELALFHQSRLELNLFIGTANTLLLLTSGYFVALAVQQYNTSTPKSKTYLQLAIIGGLGFLILKSIEYYAKIQMGIGIGYNLFFTYYWLLTLFHVVHVLVGLVILISLYLSIQKEKLAENKADFEAGAAFWHLCDLIWLLLFPMLYLFF